MYTDISSLCLFNISIATSIFFLIIFPSKADAFATHVDDHTLEQLHLTVGYFVLQSPPDGDPDIAKLRTHPWLTWKAIELFEKTYPHVNMTDTQKIQMDYQKLMVLKSKTE